MKTKITNEKKDLKTEAYADYMDRIKNESIPAYEPEIGIEELNLLEDVIKSNWLSEGKYVRQFEEKLQKAVENEEYERAAEIRDELGVMERKTPSV